MFKLKLSAVGTSTGTILPKDMLARMNVEKGDKLYAVETPEGFLLTPFDPEVAKQMEIGRSFMKDYKDTFKELAK